MSINCPQCNQIDKVQKLSAIILSDTVTGSGVSMGGFSSVGISSSGNVAVASGSSMARSALHLETNISKLLAPPRLEQYGGEDPGFRVEESILEVIGILLLICVVLAVGFACFISLVGYRSGTIPTIWPIIVFAVLTALLTVLLVKWYRSHSRKFKEGAAILIKKRDLWLKNRDAMYQVAYKRWDSLYYCARDNGVFNLEEQKLIPLSEMRAYVDGNSLRSAS